MSAQPRCFPLPGAVIHLFDHGPFIPVSHRISSRDPGARAGRKAALFMHNRFLKSAPLLLAGSLVLVGASTAQAQISAEGGFTFTTPTSTTLTVTPGQIIKFSGTFQNITALEQLDDVTIGLSPGSYGGKFTFASPFFATLAIGQSQNFTGTLKVSSTATFNSSAFYLDANGTGDDTGENYDFGSSNFTIKLAPSTSPAVPEASTTVSLGLLLGGLALLGIRARKRTAAQA